MLGARNRDIVRNIALPDADSAFDELMQKCAALCDFEFVPGTKVLLMTVKRVKREFDSRVKKWLRSQDLFASNNAFRPESAPVRTRNDTSLVDPERSGSSLGITGSVASYEWQLASGFDVKEKVLCRQR